MLQPAGNYEKFAFRRRRRYCSAGRVCAPAQARLKLCAKKMNAARERIPHRVYCMSRPSATVAGVSAIDLEEPGAALPAADAHGHHAPLGPAAPTFLQDVAGQASAGHAEGMADRDRAAVDVV